VWRTIWEQDAQVVCRVKYPERLVAFQGCDGTWRDGDLAAAQQHLHHVGDAETVMVVQRGRQPRPKEQRVPVELWACPIRLRYATHVRRAGVGQEVEQALGLGEVRLPDTKLEPWLLVTDWPVADQASALRIFRMYRQRWAAEDRYTFTKNCLSWEEVQVMDVEAVRTLGTREN